MTEEKLILKEKVDNLEVGADFSEHDGVWLEDYMNPYGPITFFLTNEDIKNLYEKAKELNRVD